MDHLLSVSLDKSTMPWSVDIDQRAGANHIDRDPRPQTIAWELAGDAAAGALTSFRWLDPVPPDGIFGAPAFAPDGKRMTMTNLNDGPATSGVWTYQLGLELHGQAYSTRSTLPIDTNTNPSIKNN